jgi:antirestriction protein ArdC
MSRANDLFESITNRLVRDIEAGVDTWTMPWTRLGTGTPVNAEGRPYRGLNVIILMLAAQDNGYNAGVWGTYKQWANLGGQVRKGEKSTQVVLWKPYEDVDAEGNKVRKLFATTYNVFAAEQVEDSEAVVEKRGRQVSDMDSPERIDAAESWFASIPGFEIQHGGDRAYYSQTTDDVHMPKLSQFNEASDYYATLAHEAGHWTGAKHRLDRQFGKRFGDEAYAFEELVAEITSAFWCGLHGITAAPRPDHAQYVGHWVKVLKGDPKAIVTAASKAQAAIDYLDQLVAGEQAQEAA